MAREPIHPGEHLADELKEIGLSARELARELNVPVTRVTEILRGAASREIRRSGSAGTSRSAPTSG